MAKRKTILVNPLDAFVPDPKPDQPSKSPAATKARSAGPPADSVRKSTSRSRQKVTDGTEPAPATQAAQPPSPADLAGRVESLEKQNVYIAWLAGGAILLMLLL